MPRLPLVLAFTLLAGCGLLSSTASEGDGADASEPADSGPACSNPCGGLCCSGSEQCVNGACRTPCTASCTGKKCGSDGCGGSCGSCTQGLVCGSSFTCEVCKPKSCADLKASCGTVNDGCGKTLNCGTCTAPATCGGGGTSGVCGCTPKTCTVGACGQMADGCGGRVDCGRCGAGEYCGANQQCVTGTCPPETDRDFCTRLGANCGSVTAFDNCDSSRTVNCGVCGAGQTCGVGGQNVCGDDCRQKPCSGLTWCDTSTGQCKAGCSSSAQCGANQTCDLGSHTCVCVAGSHSCSGACVQNTDPKSCGSSCSPCPAAPANGTVTCDGTSCGFTCKSGFHKCGTSCVSDSDVATCGTRCTACPTGTNGTPVCKSGQCELSCTAGNVYCGGRCIPCSDPNGTAICGAGGTCAFTCNSGYHFEGGACVVNVPCDFQYKTCPAGSYCKYSEGVCYQGTASCVSDGECGSKKACNLKTGKCIDANPTQTWTCTSTCYNHTGACGSGETCTGGVCYRRVDPDWCKPGIACGGNYECDQYDWKCHYMCGGTGGMYPQCPNCAMGLECVYGSSCQGCDPYYNGGGGSYLSCWPVREYNSCTTGQTVSGYHCVNGHPTMRWPCKVKSDCASAYSCDTKQGVCVPYFETLCMADADCPNTFDFRCDTKMGICLPK